MMRGVAPARESSQEIDPVAFDLEGYFLHALGMGQRPLQGADPCGARRDIHLGYDGRLAVVQLHGFKSKGMRAR